MIRECRQDWEVRLRSARLSAVGLDSADYASELYSAWLVWRSRLPWRLLPDAVALRAYELFGRRYASRWIVARGAG